MAHPEDHFSAIAAQYSRSRIGYPEELYRFLAAQCHGRDLAWDCGTGSGQAALDLVRIVANVIATDISGELLALAPPHARVSFRVAPAEASGIAPGTVDLIAVAQAIHWFDLDLFWAEARRVLKPGGVVAYWGYMWPVVDPEVDRVLADFRAMIAPSWPVRSVIAHEGYRSICSPFREIECPAFTATARWNLDEYLAHLRSWSATRYFVERTETDVVSRFTSSFRDVWPGDRASVHWPITLRASRKE